VPVIAATAACLLGFTRPRRPSPKRVSASRVREAGPGATSAPRVQEARS